MLKELINAIEKPQEHVPELDEQDIWRSLGYDDEREPHVQYILHGARLAWTKAWQTKGAGEK
jgi:hypothetical protein